MASKNFSPMLLYVNDIPIQICGDPEDKEFVAKCISALVYGDPAPEYYKSIQKEIEGNVDD